MQCEIIQIDGKGYCSGSYKYLSCSKIQNVNNSSCNAQSGCEWVSQGQCSKKSQEGGNEGQGGNDGQGGNEGRK